MLSNLAMWTDMEVDEIEEKILFLSKKHGVSFTSELKTAHTICRRIEIEYSRSLGKKNRW